MLKLLSLFSGIGAFEKALENLDEPFKVVRYCEIDKYASKAYSLIHNLDENLNLKDVITKMEFHQQLLFQWQMKKLLQKMDAFR